MKNSIILDGVNYFYNEDKTCYDIKNKVLFFIINKNVKEIVFNVLDDAYLEIINFCEIKNNTKIIINEYNNAYVKYVSNIDVVDEYNLNIEVNMLGNNSKSDILISGVVSGKSYINVNSYDQENTIDNEINENIRLLNDSGLIKVEPILRVGAMHVLANHSNTITDINGYYLFYLKTKGISEEVSINLIKNSYKYGLIKEYEKIINDN